MAPGRFAVAAFAAETQPSTEPSTSRVVFAHAHAHVIFAHAHVILAHAHVILAHAHVIFGRA